MPAPEPPPKVPRIINVLKPSSGHHVVHVRMPMDLVPSFPSKPWGIDITEIGIPKADTDKFKGYELVDILAISGTNDLLWVFQKIPGPLWTTILRGVTDLIPRKFKRFIRQLEERQNVPPDTEPDIPSGELIQSVVAQEDDTGRALRTNTSEELVIGPPLAGLLTDTWGVNSTEESLQNEGDPVQFGFGTKQARQAPTGDGKSVHTIENYPDPKLSENIIYTLEGQEHDNTYGVIIDIEKSLVRATEAKNEADIKRALGWFVECKPFDKWHTINVAAKVRGLPTTYSWCEYSNFRSPNRLAAVGVVWDSNIDVAQSAGGVDSVADIIALRLNWRVTTGISIGGFVGGVAYSKISGGRSGNALVNVTRSFHYGPPPCDGEGEAHSFSPAYGQILITGQQGQVRRESWKKGVGAIDTGFGGSSSTKFDSKLSVHNFGPAEYSGSLALTNLGDPPSASGSAVSAGGTTPSLGIYPVSQGSLDLNGNAVLELGESTDPLEEGDEIIWAIKIYPWRLGIWIKDVYRLTVP